MICQVYYRRCDNQRHYFSDFPSGHYHATFIAYQCSECKAYKTVTLRGAFTVGGEQRDTLADALKYLEK